MPTPTYVHACVCACMCICKCWGQTQSKKNPGSLGNPKKLDLNFAAWRHTWREGGADLYGRVDVFSAALSYDQISVMQQLEGKRIYRWWVFQVYQIFTFMLSVLRDIIMMPFFPKAPSTTPGQWSSCCGKRLWASHIFLKLSSVVFNWSNNLSW